jgi:hypothetical protein
MGRILPLCIMASYAVAAQSIVRTQYGRAKPADASYAVSLLGAYRHS